MRLFCTIALAAFGIIYACNKSQTAALSGSHTAREKTTRHPAPEATGKKRNRSQATIQATGYEVNLYWAIPFTPRSHGEGLVEADSGSQFVLLDLSVKNTTSDRALDMGQILLGAKIRDTSGREYTSDPLVIAAFNLEYPYPNHKEQYRSLKGILQPGESGRTVMLGFEAPMDARQFLLSLEGMSDKGEGRRYEGAFCLK